MKTSLLCASIALAVASGALAQKQPRPKTQEEANALNAAFTATDVDVQIAAANTVLEKYADTEFKSAMLQLIAADYQRKGDFPKTIVFGDRSLEADPNNYNTLLILASAYANNTKDTDFDRDEKLTKADQYMAKAIPLMTAAPKPSANLPDAEWEGVKKDLVANAHEVLGRVALIRKKPDVAVAEFKTSIDGAATQDATTYVRLAVAYNLLGKYDDAIAAAEKVPSIAGVTPQVKSIAQAERARAMQMKAKAAAGSAAPSGSTTAAPAAPKQ